MARIKQLQVHNISHRFGPTDILKNISFCLDQGRIVSIVGPSGGGKTTLMHLCANLLTLETGRIESSFERYAFAFQEPRLLPWQNTLNNIAFGLKSLGVPRNIRHQKATNIAEQLGLEQRDLTKFPKDLSGGMRQRVSFARALVTEPELLFLDEPFSALDIGLKQELQHLLITRNQTHNLSILFITHDLMEAVKLSDDILLLAGEPGEIIRCFPINTPKHLRDTLFVHETTAKLLAEPTIIETFELSLYAR